MSELSDDLRAVRDRIKEHGWANGDLVLFNYSKIYPADGGEKDCLGAAGQCCMTGAAGIAIDGERFAQYAYETDSVDAAGYQWSERAKAVIEALANNMPIDIRRYSDSATTTRGQIDRIIRANDRQENEDLILDWITHVINVIEPLKAQTPRVEVVAKRPAQPAEHQKELA